MKKKNDSFIYARAMATDLWTMGLAMGVDGWITILFFVHFVVWYSQREIKRPTLDIFSLYSYCLCACPPFRTADKTGHELFMAWN